MANTQPTDFGTDTSCTTALRTGRYASGVRLIAESLYRRFSTSRGALQGGDDEANFGLDLVGKIGTVTTASAAAALPGEIEAEALKDERIATCEVSVTSVVNGPSTSWTVTIQCTTSAGPFTLKLSVNNVTVDLLGITEGA